MKIQKEALSEGVAVLDETELALINLQARKTLTAEEVYTFGVRLCDNEVDRDFERFDLASLQTLAELFVGKSGIFDHSWTAQGQTARIYRTQLVQDGSTTTPTGEPYTYLKGYAYMVRTAANADLIREIDGGIKKEVSVSCAVKDTICSICGESLRDRNKCVHTPGSWYGEQLCYGILTEPTDAYEWSFVAVPAQPKAGVVKRASPFGSDTLKDYLSRRRDLLRQVEDLEAQAQLGVRYLKGLRQEVVRLSGLLDDGMDYGMRRAMTEKLSEAELLALKESYEKQLEEKYPPITQLPYAKGKGIPDASDGAFLI
jgi:hypothetical protein